MKAPWIIALFSFCFFTPSWAALFSGKTFPIRLSVSGCNSHYTAHCDAKKATIYITGNVVSIALRTDEQGQLHLPIEIAENNLNFDLLDPKKEQSWQRCYTNTAVKPGSHVELQCQRFDYK